MAKKKDDLAKLVNESYTFEGPSILLGGAMQGGQAIEKAFVRLPLKTMNRHGLIAGATGTGKTKTLQGIAESLSDQGVPVLLMDLKGDLSGLCYQGENNSFIEKRYKAMGLSFEPKYFPIEFLSLSDSPGVKLRATISEFGPVLLSRILDLNQTQESILGVIFRYCDDAGLLLLDTKDLVEVLKFLQDGGADELAEDYGKISTASVGTILRKLVAIEEEVAHFFGERSFDVKDLLAEDGDGNGFISVLRLADIQGQSKLFSTFMLSLLAEVFETFEEIGDPDKPKLVIFIDEAHLIFKQASKTLLEQLETIIKLIRSKGVGIVFCTQNPNDIEEAILAQLGFKIQHALRAFTAKDRKGIRMMAQNFPESDFYDNEELLTSMGIGEAMVTGLDEKGRPTPLVHTILAAPRAQMSPISDSELAEVAAESPLVKKYNETIDKESAFEILQKRFEANDENSEEAEEKSKSETKSQPRRWKKTESSTVEKILDSKMARQVGRTMARELTRGVLGVFGLKR